MLSTLTQLELARPAWLAALLLLPLVLFLGWRGAAALSAWRKAAAALLRAAMVVLLLFAAAGLERVIVEHHRQVVLVVDQNRQFDHGEAAREFVRDVIAAAGAEPVAVVTFGSATGTPIPAGDFLAQSVTEATGDRFGGDPGAALLAAAAHLQPASREARHLVLLTDGWESRGCLLRAAKGSRAKVSVVPLRPFAWPEVCLAELRAPAEVEIARAFEVEALVTATRETVAEIELLAPGQPPSRQSVNLTVGENRFALPVTLTAPGAAVLEVEVHVAAADRLPENNRRRAVVWAEGPGRILLVGEPPAVNRLAEALRGQGFEAAAIPPAALPDASSGHNEVAGTSAALEDFPLVLLAEVPAGQLREGQSAALERYVAEQGGGLAVLGGKAALAPDLLEETFLERMLPVKSLHRREERPRRLALVLVIDRSESMTKERRMELAKEAARRTVDVLNPYDEVGILAFGSYVHWVSDLGSAADKEELKRRIDALTAAGETNMYPAVQRAFLALAQADADRRHMILLTDAIAAAPGDYERLARRMAEHNITLTTVSVGREADQTLVREMARLAGGQHYHTDRPADMPSILERETRMAAPTVERTEFRPIVLRELPGLDLAGAPPLVGYAPTSPKHRAVLLLASADGDPLLAWWRYGQGVTLVLTADADNPWQAWPGYGAFWERLIRLARRPPDPAPVVLRTETQRQATTITLAAPGLPAAMLEAAEATLEIRRLDAPPAAATAFMACVAPGQYEISLELPPGAYALEAAVLLGDADGRATDRRHRLRGGIAIDYPPELQVRSVDEKLLRSVALITGGTYGPSPADLFSDVGEPATRRQPLWPWLVAAAAVLLVLETAARRLPARGG